MENLPIISKENTITKSNKLPAAYWYKLGLNEHRILSICISKVNPTQPLSDNRIYSVSVEEFKEIFPNTDGMSDANTYAELSEAVSKLNKYIIRFPSPNNPTAFYKGQEFHVIQWVDYVPDENKVLLRFAKDIIPYLTQFYGAAFFSYKIAHLANLTSTYAIRLYELLAAWYGKNGKYTKNKLEILEFRHILGIEDNKFKLFNDFKRKVVDIAVSQINNFTNFQVSVEFIKKGRAYHWIEFSFNKKPEILEAVKEPKDTVPEQNQPENNSSSEQQETETKQQLELLPAFQHALIPMPLDRQQELINQYGEEHIYYAILSANNYIQNEQAKGKSVKVGAIYNTAIKAQTGWGHELMWQAKEQQKKQAKLQAQEEAKAREEAKQAALQAEKTAEVKRKKEELHGYWNELSFEQKHDIKVASLNSCSVVLRETLKKYFDNDDFQSLFNYRVALNLETHIQEVLFAADRQFVENAQSGMNEEDNIWAETDFEEISPETVKPVEIAVKNSKSNAERADELYKDCLLKLTKKVYTVEQFTAAKDSIQFFRDGVISEDDLMIILNA